jgi:hypothetical protein
MSTHALTRDDAGRTARWSWRHLVPRTLRSGGLLRSTFQFGAHVLRDYGWWRSFRQGRCIDAAGEPIPWLTYPAIDFLSQLDYSDKDVFEFGSGSSTLFWAARARRIVSVEHDRAWYDRLRPQLPGHCELILSSPDTETFAAQIANRGEFDVIVIDGTGESRPVCSRQALTHLRQGGMIVLDNADLWPGSAAILRGGGLIQVDFTGFAPLQAHAHTTSVFFSRDYSFASRWPEQPRKSVAQPAQPWPGF